MRLHEAGVAGAYVMEPERHEDERGWFARTYCADEFAAAGLEPHIAQISTSHNDRRGTLRGMHFQRAPHEEAKLVRCTSGLAWDVVLDLRPDSPTFAGWAAAELDAERGRAMYVPTGCAHGFITLADNTEIEYLISTPHAPDAAAGVRFDDPAFGIDWPLAPAVISDRDRSYPSVDLESLRRR